jgi:tetratricopeptide (TPR) repeat protein
MRCALIIVASLLAAGLLLAQSASGPPPSPANDQVHAAEKLIASNPKSAEAFNELAHAYCRWARDNHDPALYDKAATALRQSLKLSPGNYDARKLEVAVLLGKHQFTDALTLASDLNHKVPDDIAVWGLLVDVNAALGNYVEAERDAQWILDLRAGSSLGFAKAAMLRDLFGDPEGAFEFLEESRRRTSPGDRDELAWLLTEEARMQLELGNWAKAEFCVNQALQLWPGSQSALATLADLRFKQHRPVEATALLEQRYQAFSSAENLYAWAEALEKSGDRQRARITFADFEKIALGDPEPPLSLIYYYANGKLNAPQALRLAAGRIKIRQDVATLDAYAWALYSNGKYAEAQQQVNKALAVGIRNPTYFCHAAQIATITGDQSSLARLQHELQSFPEAPCSFEPVAASNAGLK